MKGLARAIKNSSIRLDDPEVEADLNCYNQRANWVASRLGLPNIGSKMINQCGIEWVVQNHATVPTTESLHRWRAGDIQPSGDLYPVIAPQNLSTKLMEFFHAIDRCTTKTFAMLDTMPGRRKDGHVPGGNSIDTTGHPASNLLFLDAERVSETVIAHELGHAWVQYVDECEDLRTMKDATDPQRMRQVGFVQSFVLDLRVNELIQSKGFEMEPIEDDQMVSLEQLARALQMGYRPGGPKEQVFMSLLVADQIIRRDKGNHGALARFDRSLDSVLRLLSPVAELSEKMADSVRRYGYDSQQAIISCIDECLVASFEHCGERFDSERELVLVNLEEPEIDKFPEWIPILPPRLKCHVGRHMAKNDIPLERPHSVSPSLTQMTRVTFYSPDGGWSDVLVPHRIGPPSPYVGMSEDRAETLEIQRQNKERQKWLLEDPPQVMEFNKRNQQVKPKRNSDAPLLRNEAKPLTRPYMAGLGRFLTAARLTEQLGGGGSYTYAFDSPTTYVDPSGHQPLASAFMKLHYITPCAPYAWAECVGHCTGERKVFCGCFQVVDNFTVTAIICYCCVFVVGVVDSRC